MKSSKYTDYLGVSFTGNSDQRSRVEAGRQSLIQSESPREASERLAGAARIHQLAARWLKSAFLAIISAIFIFSMPICAVSQLSPELREALDYHKGGKLKEAVDVYTEALGKNPKSAEAYNWRGMAYDDLGASDKALEDFNKALEISINYADAFNNRGEVYRKQNKVPEAMNDYRRAADLEKDFAEPHYNMGLILEVQKKNDQAVREFEAYLKLKPDAPDKQQLTNKIETLKKTAVAAAPTAPAPGAPPTAAPAPPTPGVPAPPQVKPEDKPAVPRPPGPRPGAVQIPPPPPPGIDLGIPGVPPISPDMLAGLDAVSGIISLLIYLFFAGMVFLIAKKTNTSLPWLAFIPIAQFFLIINIARKPLWWLLLFFTPVLIIPIILLGSFDPTGGILVAVLAVLCWAAIPLIAWLLVCTGMAAQRGKSVIWGILAWFPCTSPIGLAYLGLSK